MPKDAVQGVFRTGVDLPEVQARGNVGILAEESVRDILWIRIHLVEWYLIGHGLEWREIRRGREAVEHRRGRGVELVHRGEAEDLFDGAEEACRVVLGADNSAALGVGADAVGRGAVPAHVVESVLRIVLDAEDDRFFPETAVAEGFDDTAESQVIVSDTG